LGKKSPIKLHKRQYYISHKKISRSKVPLAKLIFYMLTPKEDIVKYGQPAYNKKATKKLSK
jgi:hypothetical protein